MNVSYEDTLRILLKNDSLSFAVMLLKQKNKILPAAQNAFRFAQSFL